MKRLAALLLLAGAAWTAPDQLLPYDEKTHQKLIAESKGKVLLLDFWATWCAPCLEELPQLVGLERRYAAKGLKLITVSVDEAEDREAALKLLRKHQVSPPAYLKKVADDDRFITFVDKEWSGAVPALFLYDRNGKLVRRFIGEADLKAVEKAILALL